MKKLLITSILVCSLLLVSCDNKATVATPTDPNTNTSMFVQIECTKDWRVVYHKETKVMYVVSDGDYNHGTFTLLIDAKGNPMIYGGVE